MEEDLRTIIGRRLRNFRDDRKMTRERFAEEVGISPQFLAEVESGKKGMSVETVHKICVRFGLSADYLILGKVDAKLDSPIKGLLNDMPNEYVEEYVNILKAVNRMAHSGKADEDK